MATKSCKSTHNSSLAIASSGVGPSDAAVVSYVRTAIRGGDWDTKSTDDPYTLIADRGRVWDASNGRKEMHSAPEHVDRNPPSRLFQDEEGNVVLAGPDKPVPNGGRMH